MRKVFLPAGRAVARMDYGESRVIDHIEAAKHFGALIFNRMEEAL
jgi:hypothetical protein